MTTQMQPEFSTRMLEVFRAIDNLLVAHHTLRAALKPPFPPLGDFEGGVWIPASLEHGVARYGEGPILGLWVECRNVEALRVAWTGKPSPAAQPQVAATPPESTEAAP